MKRKPRFTRLGIVAFFAIVAGWAWMFWPERAKNEKERARQERQAAYDRTVKDVESLLSEDLRKAERECNEGIRGLLKAPTTARFSHRVTRLRRTDSLVIWVSGEVTAVNSFNAPLTKEFICTYDRTTHLLTPQLNQ